MASFFKGCFCGAVMTVAGALLTKRLPYISASSSSPDILLTFADTPIYQTNLSDAMAVRDTSFSSTPESAIVARAAPTTCETCLLDPNSPLCEYGLDAIRQSRAYSGSGYRVRKFLEKALRGEVVSIAILGGSVSEGHGVVHDGTRPSELWQDHFFENFKKEFPKAVMYNGPVPGTNSEVLSYCFETTVPKTADLYVVEMDVNNLAVPYTKRDDDALFRALLGLSHKPAVVRASVFSLAFDDMVLGRESALVNGQYFDVPVITITNFLLPHILEYPELRYDFFARNNEGGLDLRHVSNISHAALGDMMTLYFQEQACETRRRLLDPPPQVASRWPPESRLGKIPRLPVYSAFNEDEYMPAMTSSCQMAGSELRPLNIIKQKSSKHWEKETWNGKTAWTASTVGAHVSFKFYGSSVGIFVWESNGEGYKEKPGKAYCWADDEYSQEYIAKIDSWSNRQYATAIWKPVAEDLERGHHILHCQIVRGTSTGGHNFKIVGVASR